MRDVTFLRRVLFVLLPLCLLFSIASGIWVWQVQSRCQARIDNWSILGTEVMSASWPVNQIFSQSGYDITVLGASTLSTDETLVPREGYRFIQLDLNVLNQNDDTIIVDITRAFSLLDIDGFYYRIIPEFSSMTEDYFYPQSEVAVQVTFEVPLELSFARLRVLIDPTVPRDYVSIPLD